MLKKQQKTKPFVNNPKYEGLKVILDAANERKDEVHDYLSPHREDILSKAVFVTYHVSCRASYTRKTNVKQPDTAVHIASEVLFRRLLAASKQCDVCMEDVLSHELAAVPPALFQDDGKMRKCTQSDLAKKLESKSGSQEMYQLPNLGMQQKSAYIIDTMAVIQGLNESTFQTFKLLAAKDFVHTVWRSFVCCSSV